MTSNSISDKVFRLLDAINRNGWDNSLWGLIQDETSLFFSAYSNYKEFNGKWLYVYSQYDVLDCSGEPIESDATIENLIGDCWKLYKI